MTDGLEALIRDGQCVAIESVLEEGPPENGWATWRDTGKRVITMAAGEQVVVDVTG